MSRSFDSDLVSVDLPEDIVPLNISGLSSGADSKLVKICVRLYISLTGELIIV